MFEGATSANPDMSNWTFTNVTDMTYMFYAINIGTTNYSNLLIRVQAQNSHAGVTLHGGTATHDATATAARAALVTNGWTITDGGAI